MNSNYFKQVEQDLMNYMEYLYANGLTLDADGNIVPIETNSKKLVLSTDNEEDYE